MRFQALLVDFGGVLTTSLTDSFAAFCREHGIDPGRLRTVLKDAYEHRNPEGIVHLLETGKLSTDEWHEHLARELSHGMDNPIEPQGLTERLFAKLQPEPRMLLAVNTVKSSGFKTALVSNSWGDLTYAQAIESLFDVMVVSGEVGLRKPEPDIYLLAAKRLAVDPSSCVFVDDIVQNVDGARAVGMEGIHHTDPDETLKILEDFFDLNLQH